MLCAYCCGAFGRLTVLHLLGFIGNVEFRFICYKVKDLYKQAQRQEKATIALKIINQIGAQNPPGRFVELIEGTLIEDRRCVLAPMEQAIEKTCQALREKKNGCPRQYRQFVVETARKKKKNNQQLSSHAIVPRISDKELNVIKKNIVQVTGVLPKTSPDLTFGKSTIKPAPLALPPPRKTSRQIMMEHNLTKRQSEEVKIVSSTQEESLEQNPAMKRPTPDAVDLLDNKKQKPVENGPFKFDMAPKITEPQVSSPKLSPAPKVPMPKAVPVASKVPLPKAPPVKAAVKAQPARIATSKAPATRVAAPKYKSPPPKLFEQPLAPVEIESDDESLPENSFLARIFATNQSKQRYYSGMQSFFASTHTDPSVAQSHHLDERLTPSKLFDGKVDNFFGQRNDADKASAASSRKAHEGDGPKYPYVPYPYCFLKSLSALDVVPDPKSLTADDILTAFNLERARSGH